MLLGTYPAKLAVNHRTSIPAPLRREMGENIVIANWYDGCLVMIARSSLEALLTRIVGKKSLITDPVRGSERFLFAGAFELAPDDQGRIVIPESLIKYSGLSEDIYFLGIRDRVEIWNKSAWDEKAREVAKEAREYIERLDKNEK